MKYYRNISKKKLTFKTLIFVEKLNYFVIKNQPIDQKYYKVKFFSENLLSDKKIKNNFNLKERLIIKRYFILENSTVKFISNV